LTPERDEEDRIVDLQTEIADAHAANYKLDVEVAWVVQRS
jgi:hypothetical protein